MITISYWVIGGTSGVILGIVIAVTNLFSWYQSDKIALAAYRAQPVSPQEAPGLYQMVQKLCQRANLPMPRIFIVPSPAANAFATGRDPEHAAIAVTEGILNLLPQDELEGVIAHELTHVANRDTLTQAVAATIAGAISFLAQIVSYSVWYTACLLITISWVLLSFNFVLMDKSTVRLHILGMTGIVQILWGCC